MEFTRRSLVGLLAAGAALGKSNKHKFERPLGAELYTVRNVLPKDPEGTLKALVAIGYKEVECSGADLVKYSALYKKVGLTAPAIHADTNLILKGELAQLLDDANHNGVKYVVMPYVAPNLRGSLDKYKAMADSMNSAAQQCAKAGLVFCYHNHAFEFEGKPGQRPWDVFLERWDQKLVTLELDVFWLAVAGNDPSDVLRQFSGRVPLVHLKDKAFGVPVQYTEQVNPYAFQSVGAGTLNFVSIIKACEKAGVQHYFVEQDQTPGPPVDSLRLSYNNIRLLKL